MPNEESDVARWHRLSGLPDNVTGDGDVVDVSPSARAQWEKTELRLRIARIRENATSEEARTLARLAASYLLAGDAETAARYLGKAYDA